MGRNISMVVFQNFTSESLELISAYDVVVSKKQPQNINSYEHFIKVCGMYGLDESVLRPFGISNYD